MTFATCAREHLCTTNIADAALRGPPGARLQHGGLEDEFGRTAKKQTDSETSRKQNAKSGTNEKFHKSSKALGCAIQLSAGSSLTPG
jgi:hypothetical protein